MDLFIAQVPDAPFPEYRGYTEVRFKRSKSSRVLWRLCFATITVIKKAIELNANFIIAHSHFLHHLDETEWLENDPIYQYKEDLLAKNGIAVWRNHDYVHSLSVDGVQAGVVKELCWETYYTQNSVLNIPKSSLRNLINHIKSKMQVPALRYVGDLDQNNFQGFYYFLCHGRKKANGTGNEGKT